jgi:anti-anti-sigma factor
MRTAIAPSEPPVICQIEGNLDRETVTRFRASVATIRSGSNVIFDLRKVPFVDAAGLGALIGAARRVREAGGDAVVSRPRPPVRRALHLTAIDRSVAVVADLNEAEDYFLALGTAA